MDLIIERSNNNGFFPNEKSKAGRKLVYNFIKKAFDLYEDEGLRLDKIFFEINIATQDVYMDIKNSNSKCDKNNKVNNVLEESFSCFDNLSSFRYELDERYVLILESIHEVYLDRMLNLQ